ncbi:uncharacterized protein FMAN_11123 [Fusarium mangiferae]|uniref:Uncharacterized protein n=1 Tax=Fusarium mangiferae TaxID=192010 RepID=A0A1L7TMA6_FUSMA|nr:uncharacterized protein FMAN_11123 [Fusarium mangiferae]CVK96795.1 uncharacterized protein FMAN_11123 [Fusarium mangiferae]
MTPVNATNPFLAEVQGARHKAQFMKTKPGKGNAKTKKNPFGAFMRKSRNYNNASTAMPGSATKQSSCSKASFGRSKNPPREVTAVVDPRLGAQVPRRLPVVLERHFNPKHSGLVLGIGGKGSPRHHPARRPDPQGNSHRRAVSEGRITKPHHDSSPPAPGRNPRTPIASNWRCPNHPPKVARSILLHQAPDPKDHKFQITGICLSM